MTTNHKLIESLAEFEYAFRDGLHFTAEEKKEIALICKEIISLTEEKLSERISRI